MNIKEISKEIHSNNVSKGFWPENKEERNRGELLMLIVTELAEALEADRENNYFRNIGIPGRNGKQYLEEVAKREKQGDPVDWKSIFEATCKNTFEDEIADVAIRLFDLAEGLEIDLEWHIEQKLKYNKLREFKHGKNY